MNKIPQLLNKISAEPFWLSKTQKAESVEPSAFSFRVMGLYPCNSWS